MRPRLAIVPALILSLSGPALGQAPGPPAPPTAGSANLLVDGSFETEGPPAWAAGSWRGTFRDYATEPWDVHGGLRAAEIRVDGPADDAWLAQVVAVKPRTRYRLSGWAKTSRVVLAEPGSTTGANLSLPGRPEKSATLVGDSDWSLLGFEFETDAEEQVRVAARLGHLSSTATGTAWFDDLALVELGPTTRPPRRTARPATVPRPPATPPPPPGDRSVWGPLIAALLSLGLVLLILIGLRRLMKKAGRAIEARAAAELGIDPARTPAVPATGDRVDRVRAGLMVALAIALAAVVGLAGGRWYVLIAAFPAACALAGRRWSGHPALWGEAGGLAQSVPLATWMLVESLTAPAPRPDGLTSRAIESGAYLFAASVLAGWAAGLIVEAGARLAAREGSAPVSGGRH